MLQKVVQFLDAIDRRRAKVPASLGEWPTYLLALALAWLRSVIIAGWRRLTLRPRRYPILRPYVNPRHPARVIAQIAFPIGLAATCVVYGFMFGLTAPYLLIPFAVPIVLLALLAIWALPEAHNAPVKSMEALYSAMIVSILIWPNYLALSLPGLPWITAIRLTSFPMTLLFLISLSSSSQFRREIFTPFRATRGVWWCFLAFFFIQFITVAFSKNVGSSMQAVTMHQINWTIVLLLSIWVATKPGRIDLYSKLFVLMTLPMSSVALLEGMTGHLLWLNHVPSFLKVDDALAAQYMAGTSRGGAYRVKSIYASPLSFAEILAMATPFCIHIALQNYKPSVRIGCALLIPIFFICIRLTDARLGILGMLVSFLAYFLLWSLLQLGRHTRSLLAAAIVYAYPAAFGFAVACVLFVHKVRVLILGGGDQASSNDARQEQLATGIPKILARPFGYGAGNAAEVLGYAPFGFITIDNYYLSIALDYGILGFVAFYGTFILAITHASNTIVRMPSAINTQEKAFLIPLIVTTTVFIVIRGVLSQEDNNAIAFAMLGLLVGLTYRIRQEAQVLEAQQRDTAAAAEPAKTRPKIRLRAPGVQPPPVMRQ